MAKRPQPGRTKTRLTPELSPEQAATVYECFLLDTVERLAGRNDCQVVVAIDEPGSAEYFAAAMPGVPRVVQRGASLGERLDSVLTELIGTYDQAFAINSDSPDLPEGHLTAAFDALSSPQTDLVLGPTDDGGYWLIGWKQRWSTVVTDVTMSTPSVLTDTLAEADASGATVSLAPTWHDVDSAQDLFRFVADIDRAVTPRCAALLCPPSIPRLTSPPLLPRLTSPPLLPRLTSPPS